MRRRTLLLATAGAATAACLRSLRTPTAWSSGDPAGPASPLAADPARGLWPDVVKSASPAVQQAYQYAAANEASLRYIPCYCGCAAQGHQDNFDCYVREVLTGGRLVLDTHALGWGTCVDITRDVMAMAGTKSLREIRAAVDAKFSGVGRGTPTPLP